MTTEISVTNHPDSKIRLETGQTLTFSQRDQLAKYYIKHVDPGQRLNLYHLNQGIGRIHDCETRTNVSTGSQVIHRGQIISGREENSNQPRRIKDGESLNILKNGQPYITVRRLAKK